MRKDNWKIHVNGRGLPAKEIIDKFFYTRGIQDPQSFLSPKGNILPFEDLKNIKQAAECLLHHISMSNKVLVYADVDADGCSAAAIMYHFLKAVGIDTTVHINNEKEHGITAEFLAEPHEEKLIIIVDSINEDIAVYEKLISQEKDIIILDHHIPTDDVIANQTRYNLVSSANNYPNPHLSGSGVTWKFVQYVDFLCETSFSNDLIDLASVGIIADVCSVGEDSMENREICYNGFKNVNNCGLRAIVGSSCEMNADTIGYSIGPLVNAANRLNENKLALSLFLCESDAEAKKIVKELTKIKDKQKKLVNELFENIETEAQEQLSNLCMYFHIGKEVGTLGGLLATKASDKWSRPVLVLHDRGETYEGSMRATGVEDFRAIINSSGLASAAGHENSAGVCIPKENFEEFKKYIEAELNKSGLTGSVYHDVDLVIDRMQITPFLLDHVRRINQISGAGFPALTVLIENVRNYEIKKLSLGKHLCVETPDMKFLSWNFNNWDSVKDEGCLSAVGVIDESFFMGKRTNQMIMNDFIFDTAPTKNELW